MTNRFSGPSFKQITNDYDRNRRLLSRKWLTGVGTAGALVFCAVAGIELSPAHYAAIVVPGVAYIFGESWVDGRMPGARELSQAIVDATSTEDNNQVQNS